MVHSYFRGDLLEIILKCWIESRLLKEESLRRIVYISIVNAILQIFLVSTVQQAAAKWLQLVGLWIQGRSEVTSL
jgi:hypothetical protein